MTPYEMARRECANFLDSVCIYGGCLLARKPLKPCGYFEQCVLNLPDQPGADKMPHYFDYLDARNKYLEVTAQAVLGVKFRKCPDCGNPLRKRQRVCTKCALQRRRRAYREAQAKRRMAVNS